MSGSAALNEQPLKLQYTLKRNTTALKQDDVKLWCIIGGTPLPEIKWTKVGGFLSNDRLIFENFGKTLHITDVDFSDEGSYVCEATNGVGTPFLYSIQLTVFAAPYFTVEPDIANAAEGETVQFQCKANGKPTPEIKWIYNSKPLEKSDPNPRRRLLGGSTVVIEDIRNTDTGNYGCNATNVFGYVYKDVLSPQTT